MSRLTSMARFNEDVPEPAVVAECECCNGEIYVGDEVYRIDDGGGFVHDGCAAEYAKERVYDRSGVMSADGNVE